VIGGEGDAAIAGGGGHVEGGAGVEVAETFHAQGRRNDAMFIHASILADGGPIHKKRNKDVGTRAAPYTYI
jgi:hypothetical protein